MEEKSVITKDTLVPIGLVVAIIGGVFWFSSVFSTVSQSAVRIESLEAKVDVLVESVARMEEAISNLKSRDYSSR